MKKSPGFLNAMKGFMIAVLAGAALILGHSGVAVSQERVPESEEDEGVSEPGAVGVWKFETVDEYNNTPDSSGRGNHGIVNGAELVKGIVGNALSFDGEHDNVDCGNDPGLSPPEITIEFWIRGGTLSRSEVLRKHSQYAAVIQEDQRISFHLYTTNWTGAGSSNTRLEEGRWYHIATTYEKNGTNSIYIDGELDRQLVVHLPGPLNSTQNNLFIGGNLPESGSLWHGLIDEVTIYNRALTQDEINRHYKNALPNSTPE